MNLEAGFIGLGAMGLPIASNLLAAGVKLRVFNRTPSKAQPLVANGAVAAASPGDAATPGGVVLTMLADDAAVESMVTGEGGLAARLAPGGIHVSMSTIAPATAQPSGELSRGARQHLRGVAGLRPPRCCGGTAARRLHLRTGSGEGKSASAARNNRAGAFRLR